MTLEKDELEIIRNLVGDASEQDLAFVDCYLSPLLSVFMPVGGYCGYAVTKDHTHPGYMFFIPFDDQTQISLNKTIITVEPGNLYCLSPDIPHHEIQSFLPPRYSAVFIDRDFFESSWRHYGDTRPDFMCERFAVTPELTLALRRFMQESEEASSSRNPLLDALAVDATHRIIRTVLGRKVKNPHHLEQQWGIDRAVEYINLHYQESLHIPDIAQKAGLSVAHFNRLFKRKLSLTPGEYIMHVRLEKAKRLLMTQTLNVTEVAERCGFSTPSYFSRCFKKSFGETPQAYLKRLS